MRKASVERKTTETELSVTIDLDGTGAYDVKTGVGFLDHMLEQLARHSLIDITLRAKGDLHIDFHHTAEDSGIAIGQAVAKAGVETGFFIMGLCTAGFTMAFHITCYINDGHRFTFVGTLPRPFTKFCINNSVIPLIFFAVYIYQNVSLLEGRVLQRSITEYGRIFSITVMEVPNVERDIVMALYSTSALETKLANS